MRNTPVKVEGARARAPALSRRVRFSGPVTRVLQQGDSDDECLSRPGPHPPRRLLRALFMFHCFIGNPVNPMPRNAPERPLSKVGHRGIRHAPPRDPMGPIGTSQGPSRDPIPIELLLPMLHNPSTPNHFRRRALCIKLPLFFRVRPWFHPPLRVPPRPFWNYETNPFPPLCPRRSELRNEPTDSRPPSRLCPRPMRPRASTSRLPRSTTTKRTHRPRSPPEPTPRVW